jgi:hypothetical protein
MVNNTEISTKKNFKEISSHLENSRSSSLHAIAGSIIALDSFQVRSNATFDTAGLVVARFALVGGAGQTPFKRDELRDFNLMPAVRLLLELCSLRQDDGVLHAEPVLASQSTPGAQLRVLAELMFRDEATQRNGYEGFDLRLINWKIASVPLATRDELRRLPGFARANGPTGATLGALIGENGDYGATPFVPQSMLQNLDTGSAEPLAPSFETGGGEVGVADVYDADTDEEGIGEREDDDNDGIQLVPSGNSADVGGGSMPASAIAPLEPASFHDDDEVSGDENVDGSLDDDADADADRSEASKEQDQIEELSEAELVGTDITDLVGNRQAIEGEESSECPRTPPRTGAGKKAPIAAAAVNRKLATPQSNETTATSMSPSALDLLIERENQPPTLANVELVLPPPVPAGRLSVVDDQTASSTTLSPAGRRNVLALAPSSGLLTDGSSSVPITTSQLSAPSANFDSANQVESQPVLSGAVVPSTSSVQSDTAAVDDSDSSSSSSEEVAVDKHVSQSSQPKSQAPTRDILRSYWSRLDQRNGVTPVRPTRPRAPIVKVQHVESSNEDDDDDDEDAGAKETVPPSSVTTTTSPAPVAAQPVVSSNVEVAVATATAKSPPEFKEPPPPPLARVSVRSRPSIDRLMSPAKSAAAVVREPESPPIPQDVAASAPSLDVAPGNAILEQYEDDKTHAVGSQRARALGFLPFIAKEKHVASKRTELGLGAAGVRLLARPIRGHLYWPAILDNDSGQIGLVPCSVLTHVVVDNTPQHDSFDIADDVIVFSATDGAATTTTTAATVEAIASPTTKQDVVIEKGSPEVADEQSYVVHGGGDLDDIEDDIEDDSGDDPVILLQPRAKRRRRKTHRVDKVLQFPDEAAPPPNDDDDDAPVIVMEASVVDEAQMVEFHAPDADSSSVHDSPQSASLQSIAPRAVPTKSSARILRSPPSSGSAPVKRRRTSGVPRKQGTLNQYFSSSSGTNVLALEDDSESDDSVARRRRQYQDAATQLDLSGFGDNESIAEDDESSESSEFVATTTTTATTTSSASIFPAAKPAASTTTTTTATSSFQSQSVQSQSPWIDRDKARPGGIDFVSGVGAERNVKLMRVDEDDDPQVTSVFGAKPRQFSRKR